MTPQLRNAWTQFLILLMLRTPHMVEQITREAEQQLRLSLQANPEEYEAIRKEGHPATLLELAEKISPALFAAFGKTLLPELAKSELIGNAIIRMKWWTMGVPLVAHDLLTSDNPFCMSHPLAEPRCLVMLPLSPRFVFFGCRDETVIGGIRQRNPKGVVTALNDQVVRQARRYVYGTTDGQLRFVENRLRRSV